MKNCEDCKYCILEDHGYSNYTQEGTYFHCAKKLHPDGSFDNFYGADRKLEYAEVCEGFESGNAIMMDVDRENMDTLTDEQRTIWEANFSWVGD